MNTIELNEVKEVEIQPKKEFKYYTLYSYNPKATDLYGKYFLVDQSHKIDDIEFAKERWNLNDGETFRVFEVVLPS